MKIIVSCLNSKYVHASLSPWCLLSGVREFAKNDYDISVMESTINGNTDAFAQKIIGHILCSIKIRGGNGEVGDGGIFLFFFTTATAASALNRGKGCGKLQSIGKAAAICRINTKGNQVGCFINLAAVIAAAQ